MLEDMLQRYDQRKAEEIRERENLELTLAGIPKRRYPKPQKKIATTSMGYDRFIETLPDDIWKLLPHTCAEIISNHSWRPYSYLVMLSHLVATLVGSGGGQLMVSLPPRHGKSLFLSEHVPFWFLANWPWKKVLLSTYEANFAATWGRKVRNLVKEQGHRVGVSLAEDATASNNWSTTLEGGMITAGVGGPITGKGGDLLIVDDPHKNWQETQSATTRKMIQEWYDSTFLTRREPGGTIIIIHTRWHEDDLIGYLLQKRGYFYVRIPAIAEEGDILGRKLGDPLCPERYDIPALHKIKANITPVMWAALFQQRPSPQEGTIFLREKWKFYRVPPLCNYVLQSWDTASKKEIQHARTVCETWGVTDNGAFLLDVWTDKVEFPQLRRQVDIQYSKWRPNVILIEDKDSGQALIQTLQQDTIYPVIPVTPGFDKVVRASAVSPMQDSGRVWLPDPSSPDAPEWLDEFMEQAANFPNSRYKDAVDAMSQALAYIMTMAGKGSIRSSGRRRTVSLLENFRNFS